MIQRTGLFIGTSVNCGTAKPNNFVSAAPGPGPTAKVKPPQQNVTPTANTGRAAPTFGNFSGEGNKTRGIFKNTRTPKIAALASGVTGVTGATAHSASPISNQAAGQARQGQTQGHAAMTTNMTVANVNNFNLNRTNATSMMYDSSAGTSRLGVNVSTGGGDESKFGLQSDTPIVTESGMGINVNNSSMNILTSSNSSICSFKPPKGNLGSAGAAAVVTGPSVVQGPAQAQQSSTVNPNNTSVLGTSGIGTNSGSRSLGRRVLRKNTPIVTRNQVLDRTKSGNPQNLSLQPAEISFSESAAMGTVTGTSAGPARAARSDKGVGVKAAVAGSTKRTDSNLPTFGKTAANPMNSNCNTTVMNQTGLNSVIVDNEYSFANVPVNTNEIKIAEAECADSPSKDSSYSNNSNLNSQGNNDIENSSRNNTSVLNVDVDNNEEISFGNQDGDDNQNSKDEISDNKAKRTLQRTAALPSLMSPLLSVTPSRTPGDGCDVTVSDISGDNNELNVDNDQVFGGTPRLDGGTPRLADENDNDFDNSANFNHMTGRLSEIIPGPITGSSTSGFLGDGDELFQNIESDNNLNSNNENHNHNSYSNITPRDVQKHSSKIQNQTEIQNATGIVDDHEDGDEEENPKTADSKPHAQVQPDDNIQSELRAPVKSLGLQLPSYSRRPPVDTGAPGQNTKNPLRRNNSAEAEFRDRMRGFGPGPGTPQFNSADGTGPGLTSQRSRLASCASDGKLLNRTGSGTSVSESNFSSLSKFKVTAPQTNAGDDPKNQDGGLPPLSYGSAGSFRARSGSRGVSPGSSHANRSDPYALSALGGRGGAHGAPGFSRFGPSGNRESIGSCGSGFSVSNSSLSNFRGTGPVIGSGLRNLTPRSQLAKGPKGGGDTPGIDEKTPIRNAVGDSINDDKLKMLSPKLEVQVHSVNSSARFGNLNESDSRVLPNFGSPKLHMDTLNSPKSPKIVLDYDTSIDNVNNGYNNGSPGDSHRHLRQLGSRSKSNAQKNGPPRLAGTPGPNFRPPTNLRDQSQNQNQRQCDLSLESPKGRLSTASGSASLKQTLVTRAVSKGQASVTSNSISNLKERDYDKIDDLNHDDAEPAIPDVDDSLLTKTKCDPAGVALSLLKGEGEGDDCNDDEIQAENLNHKPNTVTILNRSLELSPDDVNEDCGGDNNDVNDHDGDVFSFRLSPQDVGGDDQDQVEVEDRAEDCENDAKEIDQDCENRTAAPNQNPLPDARLNPATTSNKVQDMIKKFELESKLEAQPQSGTMTSDLLSPNVRFKSSDISNLREFNSSLNDNSSFLLSQELEILKGNKSGNPLPFVREELNQNQDDHDIDKIEKSKLSNSNFSVPGGTVTGSARDSMFSIGSNEPNRASPVFQPQYSVLEGVGKNQIQNQPGSGQGLHTSSMMYDQSNLSNFSLGEQKKKADENGIPLEALPDNSEHKSPPLEVQPEQEPQPPSLKGSPDLPSSNSTGSSGSHSDKADQNHCQGQGNGNQTLGLQKDASVLLLNNARPALNTSPRDGDSQSDSESRLEEDLSCIKLSSAGGNSEAPAAAAVVPQRPVQPTASVDTVTSTTGKRRSAPQNDGSSHQIQQSRNSHRSTPTANAQSQAQRGDPHLHPQNDHSPSQKLSKQSRIFEAHQGPPLCLSHSFLDHSQMLNQSQNFLLNTSAASSCVLNFQPPRKKARRNPASSIKKSSRKKHNFTKNFNSSSNFNTTTPGSNSTATNSNQNTNVGSNFNPNTTSASLEQYHQMRQTASMNHSYAPDQPSFRGQHGTYLAPVDET